MEDHIISAHFIPLVFEFCGEKISRSYPGHKDVVALPEIETKYALVRDPFQLALGRIDQCAAEIIRGEDISVIACEVGEPEHAAQFCVANGEA